MRIIPRIDRDPRIVAFVQTPAGKAAALAVFAALLATMRFPEFFEILAVLGLIMLFPSRRRTLLSLSVVYWIIAHPIWNRTDIVGDAIKQEGLGTLNASFVYRVVLLVMLALFTVGLRIINRGGSSLLVRRPLLTLYLSYTALVLCTSLAPLSGLWRVVAWAFVAAGAGYLWCFSYALLDRNSPDRDPVPLQVGTFLPFWTVTDAPTPFVKGAAYLRKIEAKSPEDLAVCQLKAIKLLAWSLVLLVTQQLFHLFVHGQVTGQAAHLAAPLRALGLGPLSRFAVPYLYATFRRSVLGQPLPWYMCWASLVSQFLGDVLGLSIRGGFVVAICRMAGFRALRNTCRPLQARTIGDFWNRWYYYYKELLVDCFFYPTFVRYFRRHPRLRVVAATFAAVGLGNSMYQFFSYPQHVIELGFWKALLGMRVHVFVNLVMAAGIAVSQLRGRRRSLDRSEAFGGRVMPVAGVWLFYCLLVVFESAGPENGFGDSFRFLFHLFGIRLQ